MKALKVIGLALLALLFIAFFGGGFISELIGAYWPELGRRLSELIGSHR